MMGSETVESAADTDRHTVNAVNPSGGVLCVGVETSRPAEASRSSPVEWHGEGRVRR